jgi:hypothetical protein
VLWRDFKTACTRFQVAPLCAVYAATSLITSLGVQCSVNWSRLSLTTTNVSGGEAAAVKCQTKRVFFGLSTQPCYVLLSFTIRLYFCASPSSNLFVTLSHGIRIQGFLLHFCYIFLTNLSWPSYLPTLPSLPVIPFYYLRVLLFSLPHFQLKLILPPVSPILLISTSIRFILPFSVRFIRFMPLSFFPPPHSLQSAQHFLVLVLF